MSERSAIDEARFAQAVQLLVAAVSANSLRSDRTFDAHPASRSTGLDL